MSRQEETQGGGTSAARLAARDLRGVLLPFPTPFDERGEVDLGALRSNVARWNETGVAGYVALGSTGERVHLDEAEAQRVVEAARAAVPQELLFVVGVGQQSTRATISEARRAADAGADALLVITPHFYRSAMTQDALSEHYERVADASPAPVIIYSIPQNTGVTLAPETVGRLSRHENVIGLKESSGDVVAFVEMLRAAGDSEDFSMMTGHASAFHASLAAGARGGILAVACAVPRFAVALLRAFESGEHAAARAMQHKLIPLARAVTTRFGVGGLKYALELGGYAGGAVRAPLREPNEEARREIARLFSGFGEYEGAATSSRGGPDEAAGANKGAAAVVNSSGAVAASSADDGATGRKGAAS
ncbi:MAG TPA: dihydrodipicolinate synthase family protein [Pyrinomonadaceae bacterium]|nr:dihydrodipicolinate synthase family protein [Pyrinomonadaceae bacterium]